MLELSTFYSVVFSPDGEVLAVDNEDISAYSEEELTRLAEEILSEKKEEGMKERLLYQRKDKGDYILVAFLDNTLMLESAGTLVSYTLIFGGVALVLLFFWPIIWQAESWLLWKKKKKSGSTGTAWS